MPSVWRPTSCSPIAAELLAAMILGVKVEVRAVGLKAMRERRGLTQRKLAHDLGISQNYIPAIEGGARQAGWLQHQLRSVRLS